MTAPVRLALASLVLSAVVIVIPQPAVADTDGSILVGVDIAPRAEPTDLVKTGVDPLAGLLLGMGLAAAGTGAIAVARRRGRSSAHVAASS